MANRGRVTASLLLLTALVFALAGGRMSSAQAISNAEIGGDTAVAVSAGANHSCAVLRDGSVKCWGDNSSGQLGDGTTKNRLTPAHVRGIRQAIDVSAGDGYTCALLRSHRMLCWGANESGELGDGTTTDRFAPVAVDDVADVRAMSTESGYEEDGSTCALLQNGKIRCWGASAALGDNSPSTSELDFSLSPVTVANITNAAAISDGNLTARCAVLETGEVECWGGDYTTYDEASDVEDTSPIPIKGITEATAVVSGEWDSGCALIRNGGTVSCWGDVSDEPERTKGVSGAVALTSGESKICALLTAGTVSCWDDRSDPKEVKGVEGVVSFDGGSGDGPFAGHFCAIVSGGGAECWGDDYSGELGNGVSAHRSSPVLVTGIDHATSIGTGAGHTCASFVRAAEDSASSGTLQVACWGANQLGQLGDAKAKHNYSTRAEVSPLPVTAARMENAIAVAVGWWHACALVGEIADNPYSETPLVTNGGVKCWGAGRRGQLGLGRYLYNLKSGWIMSRYPRGIKNLKDAIAVSAGGNASCALLSSGEVDCWGGWVAPAPTAIAGVAGATAISIARDGVYMCAIVGGGQVECWNYERPEETARGEGQGELASPPSTIAGISGATAVDATSACAVVGGIVRCWSPRKSRATASVSGIDNAVGLSDSCTLLSDGHVACWEVAADEDSSDETDGEIDETDAEIDSEPDVETYTGRQFEKITDAIAFSADENRDWDDAHECVLVESGAVECWGDNYHGELGNGELPYSDLPVPVIGLP